MMQALANPQTLGALASLLGSSGEREKKPPIYDQIPLMNSFLPTGAPPQTLGQLMSLINNPRGLAQTQGV